VIRRTPAQLLALPLALALAACGGDSSSPASSTPTTSDTQCSTRGQVDFVRTTLQDIYLWYQELPDPDPAGFNSPEAYLDAVRYRPLDSSYSYITSQAESEAFFSESQFIGIGLSYQQTSTTEARVAQVFPGGPAADAGLARSDYLVAIGGRAVAELLQTGEIGSAFGPDEAGFAVAIAWRTPAGEEFEATLVKRAVTIPTVSAVTTFNVRGSRVGYVFFRNFVTPSYAALDTAFDQLVADGATDLVLDLRYNGGGYVEVAQHLGGLIGGSGTAGRVFVEFQHNDKNASRNSRLLFEDKPNALGVPRLVVITTGGSASASEAIINGLRPFMNVTVVGSATFGKPVGQYGFDFCEKVLFPVSFRVANATGEAEYFDGIPADCAAADDLDHAIADPNEASLGEALFFLRTGRCSAQASTEAEIQARSRRVVPRPYEGDGWRQLLGAY
jgi:C-terminal processing protease CtpA/Prc